MDHRESGQQSVTRNGAKELAGQDFHAVFQCEECGKRFESEISAQEHREGCAASQRTTAHGLSSDMVHSAVERPVTGVSLFHSCTLSNAFNPFRIKGPNAVQHVCRRAPMAISLSFHAMF